ncbi:MAG: DinB family protein [Planctomycetota bacterium JB042]
MTEKTFDHDAALALLERTPAVLDALLRDLPPGWRDADEGPGTWSPLLILAHLVHGEETDWVPRIERLLAHGTEVPFEPFDREACRTRAEGESIPSLLDVFAARRAEGVRRVRERRLGAADLARTGRHPAFGEVTLGQLVSTWAVHDLSHLRQIARVLARQGADAVGPWRAYLPVLDE